MPQKKGCIIGVDGRVIEDLDELMGSASELETTATTGTGTITGVTPTEIEIFLKSNGIYDEIYPVLEGK